MEIILAVLAYCSVSALAEPVGYGVRVMRGKYGFNGMLSYPFGGGKGYGVKYGSGIGYGLGMGYGIGYGPVKAFAMGYGLGVRYGPGMGYILSMGQGHSIGFKNGFGFQNGFGFKPGFGFKGFPFLQKRERDCGRQRRDVVFLLDESRTISDADFILQREFVKDIVESYSLSSDEIRIAMISFALTAVIRFDFNTFNNDKNGALDFIMNLDRATNGVSTYTDLAMRELRENLLTSASGDRAGVDNTIFVFTDGRATRPVLLEQELALFDRTVNEFFSIGVGTNIDESELILIANSEPVDHVFQPGLYENLSDLIETAEKFTCPACQPACQNEAFCNRSRNTCDCKAGFAGYRCQYRTT